MSCIAKPSLLRASRLLDRESYILADPADPQTPQVPASLRAVVDGRDKALQGFFDQVTQVLQEVQQRLLTDLAVDRCLAGITGLGIGLPDREGVRAYLRDHPDLIGPLETIAKAGWRQWLPADEATLEVYHDPEVSDEYLTLYLRRHYYAPDTMDLVAAVADVAAAELVGTSGWVLVTTDFRPPQGG